MINTARFIWQFCRHPRQTGAIAPSGRRLATAIVQALGPVEPGRLVVELGPGTGVFTRAIRHLLPNNPLMVIERNPRFARQLRERFPDIIVAEDCASRLGDLIEQHGYQSAQVGGVISGLPLLSLPPEVTNRIFAGLTATLDADTRFVNFTYSQKGFRRLQTPGFRLVETRRVFINVPPASVMTLQPVLTRAA